GVPNRARPDRDPAPCDHRRRAMKRILSLLLPILLLAACSSAGSTAPPSGAPGAAGRQVTSVEDAAARVIEVYPSLADVGPKNSNMIGACCWYTGSESGDGYTVTVERACSS